MNKIILFFLLILSFTVSSEEVLISPENNFCYKSTRAKSIDNLIYLSDKFNPYTGENICLYVDSANKYSNGFIANGVLEGEWSFWNKNGTIKSKIYYDQGKIIKKTEFYYYSNAQEQLYRELNYKNGLLDGVYKEWSEDGEQWYESSYKEGELQRETLFTYFEDSTLKSEKNYKNNKLHGKQIN